LEGCWICFLHTAVSCKSQAVAQTVSTELFSCRQASPRSALNQVCGSLTTNTRVTLYTVRQPPGAEAVRRFCAPCGTEMGATCQLASLDYEGSRTLNFLLRAPSCLALAAN
jgi:hypothetical protein